VFAVFQRGDADRRVELVWRTDADDIEVGALDQRPEMRMDIGDIVGALQLRQPFFARVGNRDDVNVRKLLVGFQMCFARPAHSDDTHAKRAVPKFSICHGVCGRSCGE